MAATYKMVYKNHCTPQEQVNFTTGSRWYLDSDCGRKMTGVASVTVDSTKVYVSNLAVTDSVSDTLATGDDFIFIKNTGGGSGNDVLISIDQVKYYILLSSGECFSSKITTNARVKVKCGAGEDSTIEYMVGT
jgi:hypothetical protein|tara:strand:+ start:112 stop:510 length:399 start_codon:yes stop_codon:yes gene_type:complete